MSLCMHLLLHWLLSWHRWWLCDISAYNRKYILYWCNLISFATWKWATCYYELSVFKQRLSSRCVFSHLSGSNWNLHNKHQEHRYIWRQTTKGVSPACSWEILTVGREEIFSFSAGGGPVFSSWPSNYTHTQTHTIVNWRKTIWWHKHKVGKKLC